MYASAAGLPSWLLATHCVLHASHNRQDCTETCERSALRVLYLQGLWRLQGALFRVVTATPWT